MIQMEISIVSTKITGIESERNIKSSTTVIAKILASKMRIESLETICDMS